MAYFTLKKSDFGTVFTRQVCLRNRLTATPRNSSVGQGALSGIMMCGAMILCGCGKKTDPVPSEKQTQKVYFDGQNGCRWVKTVSCKPVGYRYPKD